MFAKAAKALKPWAFTLAVVLITGYFKVFLSRVYGIESSIVLFGTAVAVSAWFGGLTQGLAATCLTILFVIQFFAASPLNNDTVWTWTTRLIFFFIDGIAITTVCAALRQSRDKLRLSEKRLRRVFDSNMIGVCISDSSGRVIEANDYYLSLIGVEPNVLADGRLNWRDLTAPESVEKSMAAALELAAHGETRPFEKEYIRPDGSRVAVLVTAARVDKESNIGFVMDMSQSKLAERLAQSEQFLESVVEFIPNMIFVKDAENLRFVRFNRAGEELLGSPRSALIGKSDYDFFPKEQADFFVEKDRKVLRDGVVVDIPEEPITTPNGVRYLHTKKIPVLDADGKSRYLIGISEDITEKKLTEERNLALIQAQAAREEAEKSADRLAFLKDQANEANRAKSAFLANISHELRTPLGAMLGFAELALEERDGNKIGEYVRTVLRNGRELLRIVDEVLDLSKAESDSIEVEKIRFSLPDLLREVQGLLNIRAKQKNLSLNFSTKGGVPEFAVADPFRLRQILLNMVGNAIKFTERGSVSVETSYADGRLAFLISDTGIGISDAQADRLFQPFTQADDSTTRKFGGTGLGLFLSRRIAQLLGGDVELLSSEKGKGSRFRVTVQITPADSAEKTAAEEKREWHAPIAGKHSKVLIVDDSQDNQDLLAAYLTSSKIEVERASRGSQAVELADDSYGAILMDIQMPEMDGFEALRRIRKKGVHAPVIAVTAHAMKGDRERCLASGFDEYLSKPISKKDLEQCLHHFL
jgi:PAS domain S-box-containing protein